MELINEYDSPTQELIGKGYQFTIEAWLRRGYHIFMQKPELFIVYTLLMLLMMPFGGFIISGPLYAGFFLVARRIDTNKPVFLENFFDGFFFFLPLLLMTLVSYFLVFVGTVFCILPGIYLAVAYTFSIFYILFGKMDFWDAMETSRKLIGREWFGFLGFIIVLMLVNLLGAMAFGVGLLFTIPVTSLALYAAFDDIVGIHG